MFEIGDYLIPNNKANMYYNGTNRENGVVVKVIEPDENVYNPYNGDIFVKVISIRESRKCYLGMECWVRSDCFDKLGN